MSRKNIFDKPRTLLVGPKPKVNASGVSLSFASLLSGFEEAGMPHLVVDITWCCRIRKSGSFDVARGLVVLVAVIRAWLFLLVCRNLYMTISCSRFGFIRDLAIIWPAWILRRRVVLHLKGGGYKEFVSDLPPWARCVVASTLNRATHIIALGDLLRDQFSFVKDSENKVVVVPNGTPARFDVAHFEEKTPPGGAVELRILYMSNLIPSKGYRDVLKACGLLQSWGLDFRCDFCGAFLSTINDTEFVTAEAARKEFEAEIESMELSAKVRYHGTVRGETKERLFREAHVFVLPTNYPWEGQPISIIEALAFGCPVISTAHKGIPEQVIHDYNGFLVPFGDSSAIANCVKKLLSDRENFFALSLNARSHFEANFTRDAHLKRLMGVILGE